MSLYNEKPSLPYYAVIFTSKLIQSDVIYKALLDKMIDLASMQEGFLGVETSSDEIHILISYWKDLASIKSWKEHTFHDRVQKMSKEFWFESYDVKVVKVEREYGFSNLDSDMLKTKFPKIATPRGVLMLLEDRHAPLLHQYVKSNKAFFEPWEPMRHESYYSLETAVLRVNEMRKDFIRDKGVVLCLLNKDETEILAYSNYSSVVRGVFQACYLGYSVSEKYQGQGYMKEALTAGIKYVNEEMNIDRIMANYMPHNEKSARVLHSLGFEKEGKARNYLKIAGNWEDHIMTALILR
ncbi:GNAT family N-acetyltransferase [Marinomonas sp. 15G1-11]|uniref:GNAT family N-acetyltransferase n=1 Tax=Marinomonas phaeophyticola TaxID=3004091 RepID=A0ABT4JYN1_9GAMM|nr:GNAT family N-acetyltransferase [Marinomonas sp. 15G1-11]MCZ2723388.1 GNAT family N-acetyltransferase [Marinomonas sp. 15G1-11]